MKNLIVFFILLVGGFASSVRADFCTAYDEGPVPFPPPTTWTTQSATFYDATMCVKLWGNVREAGIHAMYAGMAVAPVASAGDALPASAWGTGGGGATPPDPASSVLHLKATYIPDRIHAGYLSDSPPVGTYTYIGWYPQVGPGVAPNIPVPAAYYNFTSAWNTDGTTFDLTPFDKKKWIEKIEWGAEPYGNGAAATNLLMAAWVILNYSDTSSPVKLGHLWVLKDTGMALWPNAGSCGNPGPPGQPHGFHYSVDLANNTFGKAPDNFCGPILMDADFITGACPATVGTVTCGGIPLAPLGSTVNGNPSSNYQGWGFRVQINPDWGQTYNGRVTYMRVYYFD